MRDKWGQHARSVVPEQTLEEDPPLHIEPVPSFDLFKRKELDQFVKIFLVVEELVDSPLAFTHLRIWISVQFWGFRPVVNLNFPANWPRVEAKVRLVEKVSQNNI